MGYFIISGWRGLFEYYRKRLIYLTVGKWKIFVCLKILEIKMKSKW